MKWKCVRDDVSSVCGQEGVLATQNNSRDDGVSVQAMEKMEPQSC